MVDNLNLNSAKASDLTNAVEDFEIPALNVDSAGDQKETEWMNSNWQTYWGAFNSFADLKSAMIMKATWNVGKGYTTDEVTKAILENLTGWGKDTFLDIIFNMELIKRVGGDAYAEIIRNKAGTLVNLKPLDPGTIKIIVNRKGVIKRYEQSVKINEKSQTVNKWKPNEIFHLSNNRLADQIHGISDIESLKSTLEAEEESFEDMKKIMHRQARPMIMFKLGTDDTTKVSNFISKMDAATNDGENIYVPDDENAVTWDVVQVNVSQLVMQWRDDIRNKFYRTIGLPQVVPGAGGKSTESESKVIYLAFEQLVEKDQKYLEEQIWSQLAIKLDFIPPATLAQDLQRDESKDAGQQLGFQPSETATEPEVQQ